MSRFLHRSMSWAFFPVFLWLPSLVLGAGNFPDLGRSPGRESSFAIIPDTQHLLVGEQVIVLPMMQDWIWDRWRDCHAGVPRDDSTASGCINWMGVVSVGDIVDKVGVDDYTNWINFYNQFGTLGNDGLGPIPFMTVDGNHDEEHSPDYPECVKDPPCECGGIFQPGLVCDERLYKEAFPISRYSYPGSGLLECCPPITNSYNLEDAEDLNCVFRWPTGYFFDALVFGYTYFGFQAVLPGGWGQQMLAKYPGFPTFGFSHRHVKVNDGPIYDPDDCSFEIGEYWVHLINNTPGWVAWFNGHDRALTGVPEEVHDGKPACAIVQNNAPHPGYPSGTPAVMFFLNYQDNLPAEVPFGLETAVVEVITINWDQNTMNVQIYEPTKDAYVPEATAQYANHTWTDLELDRFRVLIDTDGDEVVDIEDNCPTIVNPNQEDADQDTIGDACDNCVHGPNPEQDRATFGQNVVAADKQIFSWSLPADIVYVKGDITDVGLYAVMESDSIPLTDSFTDSSVPLAWSGFYYLFQPDCPVNSWQTSLGAEPERDHYLP